MFRDKSFKGSVAAVMPLTLSEEPQRLLVAVGGLGPARCQVGRHGTLSVNGIVCAPTADEIGSDWLIGATCGGVYHMKDKSVLPPFGGKAGSGSSNAVINGGDVSHNRHFALAYSYGTGEAAVLKLEWLYQCWVLKNLDPQHRPLFAFLKVSPLSL